MNGMENKLKNIAPPVDVNLMLPFLIVPLQALNTENKRAETPTLHTDSQISANAYSELPKAPNPITVIKVINNPIKKYLLIVIKKTFS